MATISYHRIAAQSLGQVFWIILVVFLVVIKEVVRPPPKTPTRTTAMP